MVATSIQARRRVQWPGLAAVVVSIVHTIKRFHQLVRVLLDRKEVGNITAFLFDRGSHEDPYVLECEYRVRAFKEVLFLAWGSTFDDKDKKGVASSLAAKERLTTNNPDNSSAIMPYIGGKEVNTSPTHLHHRFVINFGESSEEECRELSWPDL